MTDPGEGRVYAGTLADLATLMAYPPGLRRGNTYLVPAAQPAAGAQFTYTIDTAWWERIISLYFIYAASGGGPGRQVSIQMQNSDGVIFNTTPTIPQIKSGETWTVSADLADTVFGVIATSVNATGTSPAPSAGTTIASASLQPGEYTVTWNVSLSGTVAAADQNNFQLKFGGTVVAISDNPPTAGGPWIQNPVTIEIPAGGSTLNLIAVGTATAGSVYDGAFSCAPVGPNIIYPQLPNIIMKPSYKLVIASANIGGADQISAIQILTERYPSNWADGSLSLDLEDILRARLGW